MQKLFDVIFEDENLLVINKPAGLVCHPTKGDEYSSLIGRIRLHLDGKAKPYLIHRLDRETSGVVLAVKSSEVAGELGKVWEKRAVQKEYLAIVHGAVAVEYGIINAPIGADEKSNTFIKDRVREDGASAATEFWRLKTFRNEGREFSLLRVVPQTGRKHQIRIHMEHYGHALVGDKIYGGDETLYLSFVRREMTDEQWARLILPHQALHAQSLEFEFRGERKRFAARPEAWFRDFAAMDE